MSSQPAPEVVRLTNPHRGKAASKLQQLLNHVNLDQRTSSGWFLVGNQGTSFPISPYTHMRLKCQTMYDMIEENILHDRKRMRAAITLRVEEQAHSLRRDSLLGFAFQDTLG